MTAVLHEDEASAVYRGVRTDDRRRFVVKVLGPARRRPRDVERIKNEYDIGSHLDTRSIVKPVALESFRGAPALVFEDFNGVPLDRLLGRPLDLESFLRLSVRMAHALGELHAAGVIHKDIKPENVLVDPRSGAVKLTDLELASLLPAEPQALSPRPIEGSLPYMSPEQTGRTNQAVDNRTDLYSLGVTLYRMLAGRLPFEAHDPLGWIHNHLARPPPSLAETAPGTPAIVAAIVAKLVAKAPEDRYQSAFGLEHDLERCLERLRPDGAVAPFALGEWDVSERFQIPQRLYGREAQVAALLFAFERVVATGSSALSLVLGHAGVGKTTLVRELHKPIVRERGFFVAGKFEEDRRIPYAPFSQAFGRLILGLLAEREEQIADWRARLQRALGANAQLVVDVVPELELILGKQPAVPELPPERAEERFLRVFRQFVAVLAQKEHPLALFLDDLQWADQASLKLLEHVLLAGSEVKYLFVIGAYRENEVGPAHPLLASAGSLRRAGVAVHDVALAPLTNAEVQKLVADAARTSHQEVAPLVELAHRKTGGNPFFVIQFLSSLQHDKLIRFDAASRSFRWDLDEIRAKRFTDNVVDLVVARIRKLPSGVREALELAACLGNTFDLPTLSLVHERSADETERNLAEAMRVGLVVRSEGEYRFLHDRVQQAARSLVPDEQRAAVHLRIGRVLAGRAGTEHLAERVFEIVNQLNLGVALVCDQEEKDRLAELNLMAGRRAKASAAYGPAMEYLAKGLALLGPDAWTRRYRLSYDLHLERVQCAYASKAFEDAESCLATLLENARTRVDEGVARAVGVRLYTTKEDVLRAIEMALAYLRPFGIDAPLHPSLDQLAAEYQRVLAALGDRPIESLADLPAMEDAEADAVMSVIATALTAAFNFDQQLWALLACHGVRLSLERGNTETSTIAYHSFAVFLVSAFAAYEDGAQFARLNLRLLRERDIVRYKAEICCMCAVLQLWVAPVAEVLPLLNEGFEAAVETGDVLWASYCSVGFVLLQLMKGEPLNEVAREAERRLDFVRGSRIDRLAYSTLDQLLFIQKLRGGGERDLDGAAIARRINETPSWPVENCSHFIHELQVRFHFGRYAEALEAAEHAHPLLWTAAAFPQFVDYLVYRALTQAQLGALDELSEHEQRLRAIATSSPANYLDRALLVSAEVARLEGRADDATALYEEAIAASRQQGMVQNLALAYELAASFHAARGDAVLARAYLAEARARYASWGAAAKVDDLDARHPELSPRERASAGTFHAMQTEIDLLSVVKASQTISGEIVLDELLRTLVRVVMEQGGAQRGCLLLERDGRLVIEAMADLDERGVHVELLHGSPLTDSRLVPETIVRFAARSRRRVILDDVAADAGPFEGDEYLQRRRPRSILCLPVLRQAKPIGYLYLENTLASSAFTPERLSVLELLAAQAAISIDNAKLLAGELAARKWAEDQRQRAAFLAEAGALLSQSLVQEEVLDRLSSLIVHSLADWCAFDMVDGDELRRRAGAHRDPAKTPRLRELAARYPRGQSAPHPLLATLRTGEPQLVPEITDAYLREHTADAEQMRMLREIGTDTGIAVALRDRGRVVGVLMLAAAAPRRFGPADLELVEELARRASMSIENARLYRESQEAVRLRDEFLNLASHELRTPLAALKLIVWPTTAPKMPLTVDGARRIFTAVARQTNRLAKLVDGLLTVTNIQAGQLPLNLEDVDLATVVRDVVERFEAPLRQAGCAIALRSTPSSGRWDRKLLDEVVTSLLDNAIKFGPRRPIEITVEAVGDLARLVVSDHGIGIPEDRLPHVFERFERAVSADHYGGLGTGLYVARGIVEAHGGKIRAESRPGAGATFTVELPRRDAR